MKIFTEEHKRKLSETKKRNFLNGTRVYLKGPDNPKWKGGRVLDWNGYVHIKTYEHPHANPGNYVYEHRLVMEKSLGRYLTKEEEVHHINGIRDDNRIENLELFANHSEHGKVHPPYNKRDLKTGRYL